MFISFNWMRFSKWLYVPFKLSSHFFLPIYFMVCQEYNLPEKHSDIDTKTQEESKKTLRERVNAYIQQNCNWSDFRGKWQESVNVKTKVQAIQAAREASDHNFTPHSLSNVKLCGHETALKPWLSWNRGIFIIGGWNLWIIRRLKFGDPLLKI